MKLLNKFVTIRGSPGRKPRLPREPRLTLWEPLAYTIELSRHSIVVSLQSPEVYIEAGLAGLK